MGEPHNVNLAVADMLLRMQTALSDKIDGVSDKVSGVKDDLAAQLDVVQAQQQHTARKLEAVEQRQATQQQELGDLRVLVEERTGGIGLTKTQKAALWTAVSGVAIEALRHLSTLFSAAWMFVKTGGFRS